MSTVPSCSTEKKSSVQTFFIDPEYQTELHPENAVPANEEALYSDAASPANEYAMNTTAWD